MITQLHEQTGTFNGITYTADAPRIPCTDPDCDRPVPHFIAGYPGELTEAMKIHNPTQCTCSLCYIRRAERD